MAGHGESSTTPLRILITGGSGLIGSHLAAELHQNRCAYQVHIVDQKMPESASQFAVCHNVWICNLRDRSACGQLIASLKPDVVFHMAANMGGMGFIHGNQSEISGDNTLMTLNLIAAMQAVGSVKLLFFASTACVYNHSRQSADSVDPRLNEARDVYPQERKGTDAYARSKLFEEEHLFTFGNDSFGQCKVLVARFHNVYGRGTWYGGREKLPMATLRKAIVAEDCLELWGTGTESRSFIYVDDAVSASIQLFERLWAADPLSDIAKYFQSNAINIGSDTSVTVKEVALTALRIAGKEGRVRLKFEDKGSLVRGACHRNSDNTQIKKFLPSFAPRSLPEGLAEVFPWLAQQIKSAIDVRGHTRASFATSKLIDHTRRGEPPSWGLLLPIRPGHEAMTNFKQFLDSLRNTAKSAMRAESLRLFIGLDVRDDAEAYVRAAVATGIPQQYVYVVLFRYTVAHETNYVPERGAICHYWRILAQHAFQSGCFFTLLLGDDVKLLTNDWPQAIEAEFKNIAVDRQVPEGFGCVCFEDISFPGFPTFPVVTRVHYDMFPSIFHSHFKNQDADPFLYQLYRRFGAERYLHGVQLQNTIGGATEARYEKKHIEWTTDILSDATSTVRRWLQSRGHHGAAVGVTTIDVVVPTFRCIVDLLVPIVRLKDRCVADKQVHVQVIVICDNPLEKDAIRKLERQFLGDPNVRIRCNAKNLGASAARNRGLSESAAEYVIFIDDDVTIPNPNLIMEYLASIRQQPEACGFAGLSRFPPPPNARCRGMHLSGATFFWTIARVLGEGSRAPWAVTANVCLKRHRDVRFDEAYPKTGGGEDIAFCNETSKAFGGAPMLCAPRAVIEHPYWSNGHPPLARFFGWAYGDGLLNDRYRWSHTYRSALDCTEFCLFGVPAMTGALQVGNWATAYGGVSLHTFVLQSVLVVVAVQVVGYLHTLIELLRMLPDDTRYLNAGCPTGCLHLMACAFWATCVSTATELGRVYGHWDRGTLLQNVGVRYMWWGPENQAVVADERVRQKTKLFVVTSTAVAVLCVLTKMLP